MCTVRAVVGEYTSRSCSPLTVYGPSAPLPVHRRSSGFCNTLTGKCACYGRWTGPTCDRAIGDFSVPAAASDWYQPSVGVTWEWQIDGEKAATETAMLG